MSSAPSPGGAVENGRIVYTSVSQIKKFDERETGGCERRWWFRYVKRLPDPAGKGAEIGEDSHKRLEHYLKTGEDVLGPIERPGLKFLPLPGPDIRVEQALEGVCAGCGHVYRSHIPDCRAEPKPCGCKGYVWPDFALKAAGVPFIGKIDFEHARGEYVDPDAVLKTDAPGVVEVGDHKTTSNLSRYAKTGEELASETQMMGYARSVGLRLPGVETVRLSHIYYQTKTPYRAEKRTTLVSLKTVNDRWESGVVPIVERMKGVAGEASLATVRANHDACYSYGKPCPFMAQCRNPLERLEMSLLERLQKNTTPTPEPLRPGLPPPAALSGGKWEYSPQQQELLKIDAQGNPIASPVTEPAPKKLQIDEPAGPMAHEVAGVLPPDAPKSDPEIAAECEACAKAGKSNEQHKAAECPTLAKAAAPVAEPKKRGRKPKNPTDGGSSDVGTAAGVSFGSPSTTAIASAPATDSAAPPEAAKGGTSTIDPAELEAAREGRSTWRAPYSSEVKWVSEEAKAAVATGAFDLFIDCIPSSPYGHLEKYVAMLHNEVVIKGTGMPDAALVEYGKGKGLLRAAAAAQPPGRGAWVVFSSDLAAPVIEALIPLARVVVRGVR